jgi:hypothetical protein
MSASVTNRYFTSYVLPVDFIMILGKLPAVHIYDTGTFLFQCADTQMTLSTRRLTSVMDHQETAAA